MIPRYSFNHIYIHTHTHTCRFSLDDRFLITSSNNDSALLIWRLFVPPIPTAVKKLQKDTAQISREKTAQEKEIVVVGDTIVDMGVDDNVALRAGQDVEIHAQMHAGIGAIVPASAANRYNHAYENDAHTLENRAKTPGNRAKNASDSDSAHLKPTDVCVVLQGVSWWDIQQQKQEFADAVVGALLSQMYVRYMRGEVDSAPEGLLNRCTAHRKVSVSGGYITVVFAVIGASFGAIFDRMRKEIGSSMRVVVERVRAQEEDQDDVNRDVQDDENRDVQEDESRDVQDDENRDVQDDGNRDTIEAGNQLGEPLLRTDMNLSLVPLTITILDVKSLDSDIDNVGPGPRETDMVAPLTLPRVYIDAHTHTQTRPPTQISSSAGDQPRDEILEIEYVFGYRELTCVCVCA
jgi:hypothetical protein